MWLHAGCVSFSILFHVIMAVGGMWNLNCICPGVFQFTLRQQLIIKFLTQMLELVYLSTKKKSVHLLYATCTIREVLLYAWDITKIEYMGKTLPWVKLYVRAPQISFKMEATVRSTIFLPFSIIFSPFLERGTTL